MLEYSRNHMAFVLTMHVNQTIFILWSILLIS